MDEFDTIQLTLADFEEAARKYRKELLRMPVIGLEEILPYVTTRIGIRGSETVVSSDVTGVQVAPYKPNLITEGALDLAMREIRNYFGTVNIPFEPNKAISTILGHRAFQAVGEQLSQTPTAKEVLALLVKAISSSLNACIWLAVRDPKGKRTVDLFNGWDTITDKEITAGNISAAKGNYRKLDVDITAQNAVEVFKQIMFSLSPELRGQECFIYLSQELLDLYNEGYLLTHQGIVYNDKYNQVAVEGSSNRLTFVPLVSKAGSKYIHITTKENMIIALDQLSDKERVFVGAYQPDTLTLSVRLFFGVDFETVDKRRFKVIELKSVGSQKPVESQKPDDNQESDDDGGADGNS